MPLAETPTSPRTPIQHVIVIVKENHTFDNYFGQFPGADGAKQILINGLIQNPPHAPDRPPNDIDHSFIAAHGAWNGGEMDRFEQLSGAMSAGFAVTFAQYNESDLPAYWTYAKEFSLFDHYFSSVMGRAHRTISSSSPRPPAVRLLTRVGQKMPMRTTCWTHSISINRRASLSS